MKLLKQYICDLRENYDNLLSKFSQLEGSAKEKVALLENRARVRSSVIHRLSTGDQL